MGKSVKQVLHLLALIERKEHLSLDTWSAFAPELADNLDALLEWDFVTMEDNEPIITDKGRNTLNDFDRGKREVTPIRVQVGSYYRGKY